MPRKTEAEYEVEQIQQKLIGGRIVGAIISPKEEDSEQYFGLQVEHPVHGTLLVWVNRDPEGNGPGHLSIES